jgi:hypothetical protein
MLDSVRLKEASKYLCGKHTISTYLKGIGKWNNPSDKGGQDILVSCPFHEDYNPSCSCNDKRGVWHCFSCGRGGDFINLLCELSAIGGGKKIPYSKIVDDLLRADKEAQFVLGYLSVFAEEKQVVDESFRIKRFKFSGKDIPPTYIHLADKMKKCGLDTVENISYAQELMFQYKTAGEVWDMLKSIEASASRWDSVKNLSIDDILRGGLGGSV